MKKRGKGNEEVGGREEGVEREERVFRLTAP